MRVNFKAVLPVLATILLACGTASADAIFTQSNTNLIACSGAAPCGTVGITQGTGLLTGDLVITVQLSGGATNFQLDRFGFDSNLSLTLECFAFTSGPCTSGSFNGASLEGSKQFGEFGRFDYDLETGLHGGSGCCKKLFTFVIGKNGEGALSVSDVENDFAGHAANSSASGFIATGDSPPQTPEPSSLLLMGSGLLAVGFGRKRS